MADDDTDFTSQLADDGPEVSTEDTTETVADDTGETGSTDNSNDGGSEKESGEEWDADRAKEKIRRTNSENRNLREREKDALTKLAASNERIGTLEKRLNDADRKAAAMDAGLPTTWAGRLQGSTLEEWTKDARAIADEIGAARPVKNDGASHLGDGGDGLSEADAFFM